MNIKTILAVGAVILFFVANWFSYNAGVTKERAADAKAMVKHTKKVAKLITDLEI